MNENDLLARIGRLSIDNDNLKNGFHQLLDLTAKIVSGEIDRSRVMVNLTDKIVTFAPEGFRPEFPATVNGLPHCVVATEEKKAE